MSTPTVCLTGRIDSIIPSPGSLKGAHARGVAFCRKYSEVVFKEKADIVVTTNAGYPLDQDFYQTVKGLVGALPAVKKGGTIIIAAECCRGIGSDNFKNMLFAMKDADSFLEMIAAPGFFVVDQWEVEELIKALKFARIKVYSTGIPVEELKKCHVEPIASVERGIEESLEEYGPEAKITVIPSGPYVIPAGRRQNKQAEAAH